MAEVGKEDFERARSNWTERARNSIDGVSAQGIFAETNTAIIAALDQAIAACDVDVEALKLAVKRNNLKEVEWSDAEISEHEAEMGDMMNYGYHFGGEQAVEDCINYLASLGFLRTPATGGGVPDGWKLVPTLHDGKAGLTWPMHDAFWAAYQNALQRHGQFESTNAGYNAMLAAAPQSSDGEHK